MDALLPLVFSGSMVCGASTTDSIDLSGCYKRVSLEIKTQAALGVAGTPLWILGSSDGTTFRRMTQLQPNTATTTILDFVIASNTTNRIVPLENWGARYMKVEASAVVTAGAAWVFNVICIA